jgi:SAM-dependent methyltransferase
LQALAAAAPQAHVSVAATEALPLRTGSVDVVVMEEPAAEGAPAPSARSLAEAARVLRPGGVVSTLGTRGDRKVPWVKKVYALAGVDLAALDGSDPLDGSDLFEVDETSEVRHWETFRRHDVVGFVLSHPMAAGLDSVERERLTIAAEELYDGYGRGPDGLLMPWLTRCRRAKVAGLARAVDDEPTERIVVPAPPSDDGLLVDFR